ncbi:hypothetical protein NXW73_01675 [Bacteroides fragilis]|nr:hypothetical protein [Bacteroides fragilis]UVP66333.1 hypothetical protein NXW33_09615 [Bacteroides fragilis]
MSSGSVCPEARLCRNETAALFHSDPGSASSLPGSFGKKRPGYPEIYQEEYEESPEETGNVPKGKRKLAPTLIISKSALDKNKLMPRERRTHAKYIIFAGQTIKEIWNK